MRQALVDLGLDDELCRRLGIRVHKVNVVWPLEATIAREFAQGLQEILVVEEKRQLIEYQLKETLYNWRADVRPRVLGKFDEVQGDDSGAASGGEWAVSNPSEHWLLRAKADLTPSIIAKAIARRLSRLGVPDEVRARMQRRLDEIAASERAVAQVRSDTGERLPWFCSGCPHNTSTRVPEGSRAVAGIGWTAAPAPSPRWAARARPGSARRRSPTSATCSPTSATAPTSTAASSPSGRPSPPG
jgi:indolepyruvate ferredoxin oxidoreductase